MTSSVWGLTTSMVAEVDGAVAVAYAAGTPAEYTVTVTVDDASQLEDLLVDLRSLGDVAVERNRGIVALVGGGLSESGAAMARALGCLGDLRLHMLSLSATGINLTMVVDGDEVNPLMQRLHKEFFEGAH